MVLLVVMMDVIGGVYGARKLESKDSRSVRLTKLNLGHPGSTDECRRKVVIKEPSLLTLETILSSLIEGWEVLCRLLLFSGWFMEGAVVINRKDYGCVMS